MCENQLSKLITLKNVGDFLQFSQLYLAQQLEVSAVQPTFLLGVLPVHSVSQQWCRFATPFVSPSVPAPDV